MSYRIYSTDGIVIGSKNYGEADKLYKIFTKELGTVFAHARSIRKLESKLSSQVKTYAVVNFSFVRGKDVWRITTSELVLSFDNIFEDVRLRRVYARIFSLLEKLLKGEDKNEKLYNLVLKGLIAFDSYNKESKLETIMAVETILVWRILYELGYADDSNDLLLGEDVAQKQIIFAIDSRPHIINKINKSLEATHLL